jgi:hypothetical protein
LAQDAPHVDLNHREFVEELLHGLMNHHVPEDLRGDVASWDLKVYEEHLQMDDALQI